MRKRLTVLVLGLAVLAACKGNRVKMLEDASAQGSWRSDGTLIRQYDVTLTEAYDAILQLAKDQDWRVTERNSSPYGAEIRVVSEEGEIPIHFSVWAPKGKAVEIGIEYNDGDRIESMRVFDKLEPLLPKKVEPGAN